MLKIERSLEGQVVVFAISGRLDKEHIAELEKLISVETEGDRIVLDLKDVILAGQDAVGFLDRCETGGIMLLHCAGYIREWITRQRGSSCFP